MKRIALAVALVLAATFWWACSKDAPPMKPAASEAIFAEAPPEPTKRSAWQIGPIEGLTTAWHSAPERTPVPIGTTVRFRCATPNGAKAIWSGAIETSRTSTQSTAECPVTTLERQTVRVEVAHSGVIETHTSILQSIDVDVSDIRMSAISITEMTRMEIDEGASNWETSQLYFGESIAQLRQVGENHFRTSVGRTLGFEVAIDPPVFTPLIEWRFGDRGAFLGANGIRNLRGVGTRIVSAGPPTRAEELRLDTYAVHIVSHESDHDIVAESEDITFEAVTDPPGFEDEITWISSTKYGVASPVVGSGRTFTVSFNDTYAPHPTTGNPFQWLGVKADNTVFNQDQKCECAEDTPDPLGLEYDSCVEDFPSVDPPVGCLPHEAPVATVTAKLYAPSDGQCCDGSAAAKWEMIVDVSSEVNHPFGPCPFVGNNQVTASYLCDSTSFAVTIIDSTFDYPCFPTLVAGCPFEAPNPAILRAECEVPIVCTEEKWGCSSLPGKYVTTVVFGPEAVEIHWVASLRDAPQGEPDGCRIFIDAFSGIKNMVFLAWIGGVQHVYDLFNDLYIVSAEDTDLDFVSNYDEVLNDTDPWDETDF